MRDRRKKRLSPGKRAALVLALLIVLGGIGALVYPAVSQWWNARGQSEVVADYAEEISGLDDIDKDAELQKAADQYGVDLDTVKNFMELFSFRSSDA